ncbi:START domain-containing protein 10 [Oryzias latipes]|nr:START domain-containing protein 10 [Oryzias latipes]
MSVTIPDDAAFAKFKAECLCDDGWSLTYNRGGITVRTQVLEEGKSIHRVKCRMVCEDVPAETMYDVLHDTEYRWRWDTNVIDTFDIGKLTVNADVGYYSWKCPRPLRYRDVVTLRSWLPMGNDYIIMNYSVKHSKYPPRKDMVRAISIQTGYMIQSQGPNRCTLVYLAQVDPRGSLPKWVVNKSSQLLAPRVLKKIHKASLKYSDWKKKHNPCFKPWLFPEQNTLPSIPLSELSIQRAESLEKIDESDVIEQLEKEDSD